METTAISEVALGLELPPWLASTLNEAGRRYSWYPAEVATLRQVWGRMPRDQAARQVSQVLQELTGDPNARRTVDACSNHAYQIGLAAYRGRADQLHLKAAARLVDLPYDAVSRAVTAGELRSDRRGKHRYVAAGDWEVWLMRRRAREQAQAKVLETIHEETISKQEAMAITGLSETHLTRYLQTGIVRAWKVPDLGEIGIGTWRVSLASARAMVEQRARGQLGKILQRNANYTALQREASREIADLRHQGRVGQRDPLTDARSRYHRGCFTVAQVANHVAVPVSAVCRDIHSGRLQAKSVTRGGRARYGVAPDEARRYAREIDKAGEAGWRMTRQERAIVEAGLLTVRQLARRFGISRESVCRYARSGRLPARRWGRYLVFEPEDVERFEPSIQITKSHPSSRKLTD